MLYYLFDYLEKNFDLPGAGLFQYISFRSALAIILSLALSTIFGKRVIDFLRKQLRERGGRGRDVISAILSIEHF